jgi:hypothetical protein
MKKQIAMQPSPSVRAPRPQTLALAVAAVLAIGLAPGTASACACGCGIFDIGANSAFPNQSDSGLSAFVRYNYMDQNKNWEGGSSAPASDNPDKEIKTSFITFGGQYMINHDWGVMVELPIFVRSFTSTGDGTAEPNGQVFTSNLTDFGDLMINGVYTGFSPDMSTGVTFGIKLPTGNYTGPYENPGQTGPGTTGGLVYDRDSLPGTGSTDLLLGAYHVGALNQDGSLAYFSQIRAQIPIMERAGASGTYRPGNEFDAGVGITYSFGKAGAFDKVAPVLQLIGGDRSADSGTGANPGNPNNSGYRRLMIAPGVDVRIQKVKLYFDVSIPVVQHTNIDPAGMTDGNGSGQLVASAIYRLQVGYDF